MNAKQHRGIDRGSYDQVDVRYRIFEKGEGSPDSCEQEAIDPGRGRITLGETGGG